MTMLMVKRFHLSGNPNRYASTRRALRLIGGSARLLVSN